MAGPLAVAQVEVGWLTGTVRAVPATVWAAVDLAVSAEHTAMLGELAVYLGRAGFSLVVPGDLPQPWADGLAGRWRPAAVGWEALGERYERAVELAGADGAADRSHGLHLLSELGAGAVVARLSAEHLGRTSRPGVTGELIGHIGHV